MFKLSLFSICSLEVAILRLTEQESISKKPTQNLKVCFFFLVVAMSIQLFMNGSLWVKLYKTYSNIKKKKKGNRSNGLNFDQNV